MGNKFKRVWSGVAALCVAASVGAVANAPAAFALGTLAGQATVKSAGGAANLYTGDSNTTYTLGLPAGAACAGDSADGGYFVNSYMVPSSVSPDTLTFDSNGPLPNATGASFRQPMYTTTGSPYADVLTAPASPAGGPGPIINIPNFTFNIYAPADIPAGTYNLGIACTQGGASATQMKSYWNTQMVFTTNAGGGPAQVTWKVGSTPAAPTLNTVTSGDTQLTAAFTPAAVPAIDPPTTGYTATATPSPAGPPVVTANGATSPIVIPGLVNGQAYNVTVHASNLHGNSAESTPALPGTPVNVPRPPVTGLTATPGAPGSGIVNLSWVTPTGTAPTGYTVAVSPSAGTVTPANPQPAGATTSQVTGLPPGSYTFTVTPLHPAPFVATPASAGPVNVASATVVLQDITVVRPGGDLVLTQVCGVNGLIPAETAGAGFPSTGFPLLPQVPATTAPGTAPTTGAAFYDPAGPLDSTNFPTYPYPDTDGDGIPDPAYPTHCGINLGTAKLVTSGAGRGQFFATSGVLNQVTVVDTRDGDGGWNATGFMSNFVKTTNSAATFSGSQLGWTPVKTTDSALFTDALDNSYDQVVNAGTAVAANTSGAGGLANPKTLGITVAPSCTGAGPTVCTGGLGISDLDARLKLLIPVTAISGTYHGTLTLTVS